MLGTVDAIDYDGDRLRKVVLRFPPPRREGSAAVKEVSACERIGQGSFGTVYRAVCDGYPRLALKISTGKSTRLRQELDVLSRVCTKGHLLLPRFEFGALNEAADMIVIGMELCVPSTLHDLLLSTRITHEAEMLFMGYQAVQAVSYVHQEGCIHRDIKLQNFVFDLDGNLKLIDFGLACNSLKPPPGDVVAGTVSFMSPEMAHNALHKDKRVCVGVAADVWSLGIVLFSIFTQRNPYPSLDTVDRASHGNTVASGDGQREKSDGTDTEKSKKWVSQQQRMNERLLHRVAAGDWQWPVGVTVSQDLQQLVNSILVPNPDHRPSIDDILSNKLWNLRRRYPPAAVAAFLGVQDDFLLSHDEAHLMRAVEERSAGVTASLLHSRQQSLAVSSSEGYGETDAPLRSSGSVLNAGQPPSGATTSPARSSLKVVQRGGAGGVDGAVAVEVYDVRASARKRSKPIREISVVMTEETAKAHREKSVRRGRQALSAPAPRVKSRASSLAEEGRRASSAGASLTLFALEEGSEAAETKKESQDGECAQVPSSSAALSTPLSSQAAAAKNAVLSTAHTVSPAGPNSNDDAVVQGKGRRLASAKEPSCATPPRFARDKSEELLRDGDADAAGASETRNAVTMGTRAGLRSQSGTTVRTKRPRSTSLLQLSSSVLKGVIREGVPSQPPSSPPSSPAYFSSSRPRSSSQAASRAPPPLQPVTRGRLPGPTKVVTDKATAPKTAGRPPAKPLSRAQRLALELSLSVVWQDEADHRRLLASLLSTEHAWLLASFRLTIAEDQERYHLTWLAEEQEKSAAHPHRFKEVLRVMSKKYQYGFVCDLCDYEFLPTGPQESELHFFHCPCGRDLCPECYEAYQRRCTCSCCRVVHPNSCVLRTHLLQTGGRPCTEETAEATGSAKAATRRRSPSTHQIGGPEENEKGDADGRTTTQRSHGRQVKGSRKSPPLQRRGARPSEDPARRRRGVPESLDIDAGDGSGVAQMHVPRMSIAAMQQREEHTNSARGRRRGSIAGAEDHTPLLQRPEDVSMKQRTVERVPDGPWQPFARFKKDRREEAARQPTAEERDMLLNGDWIRHFYLFPHAESSLPHEDVEEPYAFVYHTQPGRTGAIFLTSDFPMHSVVFSVLERQFFVVDHVDTASGADGTRATSLISAKGHPDLKVAFEAMQDIVAYDTNMMKQQRTPGTVSVYQAPRGAFSCNGEPFAYVRWFRFSEDRSLSAFLLSNGAVQVFVRGEYELRWLDENRKFFVRYNGVCELVDDNTFALAPAINHLLYDSFDA